MKGVILAAGKGSRLYPVTYLVPKPLLPMANRTTLHYAFDRLKEMGVTEICVVVGENEETMKAALGDGSDQGVKLSYVRQTEPKGLAHAVSFAREFVGDDPFVLYLGDAIYTGGFTEHARRFLESKCANLSMVKAVEDPSRFGVATVENGHIVRLVEKPENPESNLAMAGLYFFGSELWDVLPDLQPSARGEYEITDAIQMLIDRGHRVAAGEYDHTWFDTGTLDSFLETNSFLIQDGTLVAEDACVEGEVGAKVVVGAGARVKCVSIEDAVVLPGSDVEVDGAIRHALLGGTVRADSAIDSVILHGDWTG